MDQHQWSSRYWCDSGNWTGIRFTSPRDGGYPKHRTTAQVRRI